MQKLTFLNVLMMLIITEDRKYNVLAKKRHNLIMEIHKIPSYPLFKHLARGFYKPPIKHTHTHTEY